jgi:adenylate cyclase
LFNLYTGYSDGTFLELDFIDRAGRGFRDKLHAPADAVFRLFLISRTGAGSERAAKVIFLSQTLAPLSERPAPVDYDPRRRPWSVDAYQPGAGELTDPYILFASAKAGYTLRLPSGKDGPA